MPNDVTIYNVSEDLECTLIETNAYIERREQIQTLFMSLFNLKVKKLLYLAVIILKMTMYIKILTISSVQQFHLTAIIFIMNFHVHTVLAGLY
jgi:hypothetical protein